MDTRGKERQPCCMGEETGEKWNEKGVTMETLLSSDSLGRECSCVQSILVFEQVSS